MRRRISLVAAIAALTLVLFAPQALARYVYSANYNNDTVSLIDTATNQVVGSPIPLPANADPSSMAIAPNGKTLYVANYNDSITVIDTQSNQPVGSIPLENVNTIAISPDGRTAYATEATAGQVGVIDLQTNQVVGSPITVGAEPYGVAFSPDGKTVYVTNYSSENVSVIDTATRQVLGGPIPVGIEPVNVVFSPDGKTAYTNNNGGDTVSVIDTATRQVVGAPIPTGDRPWGLALTPDGKKLYVSNENDNNVTVIDTQSRQVVGNPIPTGDEPYELAVTPDGKSLYVPNYEGGGDGDVTVIDTASNLPITTIPAVGGPWQVAIVPDQSPIAAFTFAASKKLPLRLSFSGAGSSDPDGTIARFDWSFGDGTTALNGGPTPPVHKYAKAGTYPVSLTAVDNEGCSGMVFTGRTAHCNGPGPAIQSVAVKAPNNFKFGKLKRNVRKGTAKLQIKLPSPGKVLLSGKKVKRVKRGAKEARKITLNIRPKPKVKKLLVATGSAKVRVKVKFSPTGGKPRTKSKTLKLIQR